MTESFGIVAIGRNEGDRLRLCLGSVRGALHRVIYVDSASTDGSAAYARSLGLRVVELDHGLALSAARARNAGFAKAAEAIADTEHVQFVDGDCELAGGWPERAVAQISAQRKGRPNYWYDSRRRYCLRQHGLLTLLLMNALWGIGRATLMVRRLLRLGGADQGDPAKPRCDLPVDDLQALLSRDD